MQDSTDEDGNSPWAEIRRRYGVDFEAPKDAQAGLRLWYRGFWICPLLTLGLWWETAPGTPLHPYQPVTYLSWTLIAIGFVAIAGYHLIQHFDRAKDPQAFWRTTFAMRNRSRRPHWTNWYNMIACAAFALVAQWAHRPWLALAIVLLFATVTLHQLLENRRARQKCVALAAGENGDGEGS